MNAEEEYELLWGESIDNLPEGAPETLEQLDRVGTAYAALVSAATAELSLFDSQIDRLVARRAEVEEAWNGRIRRKRLSLELGHRQLAARKLATKTLHLPCGIKLSLRKALVVNEVFDEEALMGWATVNGKLDTLFPVGKRKLSKSALNKLASAREAGEPHSRSDAIDDGGNVIDGVNVIYREDTWSDGSVWSPKFMKDA